MSANKIAIRNVKWDAVNDMVLTQCPKHGQPNCITERIVAADHLTQRINTQLSIDPGRSILKTPGPNNKYLNLTFKKKKKKCLKRYTHLKSSVPELRFALFNFLAKTTRETAPHFFKVQLF